MDARLAMAPSDDARWEYLADALKETAERNEHTAVILERLTVQLDGHDKRLDVLEAAREREHERELEQSPSLVAALAQQKDEQKVIGGMSALFNRIYGDWRAVGLVLLFAGNVAQLLGGHVSWHW